jgi:hypothetical protein
MTDIVDLVEEVENNTKETSNQEIVEQTDTYLNDVWTFYFHDPYDASWVNESYKLLGTIGTAEEFWQHHSLVKSDVNKGIFFIMRDYVFPCWDDPANLEGGCLSIKVLKDVVAEFWEDISIKLLGETLLKEEHRNSWNLINGISTSPKKHFCIIKIWVKDGSLDSKDFFDLLPGYYGEILFKLNRENIQLEHSKGK